ncbi:MAG: HEPN domain-containing protein [Anaerolineales bacterium]
MEKAESAIGAAESLLRDGYRDFAAGRAYYAMFYTAEALLAEKELVFKKARWGSQSFFRALHQDRQYLSKNIITGWLPRLTAARWEIMRSALMKMMK